MNKLAKELKKEIYILMFGDNFVNVEKLVPAEDEKVTKALILALEEAEKRGRKGAYEECMKNKTDFSNSIEPKIKTRCGIHRLDYLCDPSKFVLQCPECIKGETYE